MQVLTMLLSLWLTVALSSSLPQRETQSSGASASAPQRSQPAARQLHGVRGEIIKIKNQGRGMLLITVRPAKDFAEVTVLAHENDLVGSAVGRKEGADLLGLLAGEARDEEEITAAELQEGDAVSVIYDPQLQNRALEIYLR